MDIDFVIQMYYYSYRRKQCQERILSQTGKVVSNQFEGVRQLRELSSTMGRSESDVVEIAVDRMYREEIRFGNLVIAERTNPENEYKVKKENQE